MPSFSSSMPDLHSPPQQLQQRAPAIYEEPEEDELLKNTRANARRPHDDGRNAHLASLIGNRWVFALVFLPHPWPFC